MDLCKTAFRGWPDPRRTSGRCRHQLALPLSGQTRRVRRTALDLPDNEFDEADISFLTMLAGAAGAAFEKAKLHEQANVLIGELRLINELTQRLNSSLKLTDTMQFASRRNCSAY